MNMEIETSNTIPSPGVTHADSKKKEAPLFKGELPSLKRFDSIFQDRLKSIQQLEQAYSFVHNPDLEYGFNPKIGCPYRKKIYLPHLGESRYIDCNSCLICAKKKAYKLSCRLLLENSAQRRFYFLTYTYNNQFYEPISSRPIQLLFKKLRNNNFNFKYILLGEYGPRTYRSHYHILYIVDKDTDDQSFLTFATTLWNKGNVIVESADSFAAFYLSSYLKKNFTDTYTFSTYSKRPAIGVIPPNKITDDYMTSIIEDKLPYFVNGTPLYIPPAILSAIYGIPESDSLFDPLKKYEEPDAVSLEEVLLYKSLYIEKASKFREKKLKFDPKSLE